MTFCSVYMCLENVYRSLGEWIVLPQQSGIQDSRSNSCVPSL